MCNLMTVTTKAKIARAKNRYCLWNVAVGKYLEKRTVNQKVFKDHVCPLKLANIQPRIFSWSLLPGNLNNEYERSSLATKKSVLMPRTILVPCYNYSSLWHKLHAFETAALNKSTGNLNNEYQRSSLATKRSVLMPLTILVPCYNYSSLWHKLHAFETTALNKSTIGVSSWREIFSVASASDVYSDHEIKLRGHCLVRDVDRVAYRWGGCRTGATV